MGIIGGIIGICGLYAIFVLIFTMCRGMRCRKSPDCQDPVIVMPASPKHRWVDQVDLEAQQSSSKLPAYPGPPVVGTPVGGGEQGAVSMTPCSWAPQKETGAPVILKADPVSRSCTWVAHAS